MADLFRAMKMLRDFQSALATAVCWLVLLLVYSVRAAQTTNALTLNDCLRESLSANHTLLARSAERDAANSRARGGTAASGS